MNVQNKVHKVCTVVCEDLFWFYWTISIGVEVGWGVGLVLGAACSTGTQYSLV